MSGPVFTPKEVIETVVANTPGEVWHEQYFARDYAVMGRVIIRTHEAFAAQDMLIATVNPNIKDGAAVASDIAEALNEKFNRETENV